MKKYSEFVKFLNEASGKNYIDVFNEEAPFKPVYQVHKAEIMEELDALLSRRDRGLLKSVSVSADLPMQGKRMPAYLADVLPKIEKTRTPEDRPEGEEPDDINVFVDVEFEVVELDKENNRIVAIPNSLKRKNITVPIEPRDVIDISFKRIEPVQKVPDSYKKAFNLMTNKNIVNDPNYVPPIEG